MPLNLGGWETWVGHQPPLALRPGSLIFSVALVTLEVFILIYLGTHWLTGPHHPTWNSSDPAADTGTRPAAPSLPAGVQNRASANTSTLWVSVALSGRDGRGTEGQRAGEEEGTWEPHVRTAGACTVGRDETFGDPAE